MPRYFFDFPYGDDFIDPSGFDRENEAAAIEKAARAIGILLDKLEVDPTRRIAVRHNMGKQASTVPVYSTPSEEHPAEASGAEECLSRMTG
jgi:hypothetical protein